MRTTNTGGGLIHAIDEGTGKKYEFKTDPADARTYHYFRTMGITANPTTGTPVTHEPVIVPYDPTTMPQPPTQEVKKIRKAPRPFIDELMSYQYNKDGAAIVSPILGFYLHDNPMMWPRLTRATKMTAPIVIPLRQVDQAYNGSLGEFAALKKIHLFTAADVENEFFKAIEASTFEADGLETRLETDAFVFRLVELPASSYDQLISAILNFREDSPGYSLIPLLQDELLAKKFEASKKKKQKRGGTSSLEAIQIKPRSVFGNDDDFVVEEDHEYYDPEDEGQPKGVIESDGIENLYTAAKTTIAGSRKKTRSELSYQIDVVRAEVARLNTIAATSDLPSTRIGAMDEANKYAALLEELLVKEKNVW